MPLLRSLLACLIPWIASGEAKALNGPAAPDAVRESGMPPLRAFTARDTGVKTMAWSAVQDGDGRMYFGCDTVVSFDGDRWRPLHMDPTYAIRGLDIGPNGRIWCGGVNQVGWFEAGALGRLSYHSLMDRLPPADAALGDVWRVYAQGADSAFFVTHDRILRWAQGRFTVWNFPGVRRMLWSTRTAKAVYVHYPPLGLLRMAASGPEVAVPASAIGASDIRWLDDSGADWLLLTADGFRVLRNGGCTALDTDGSAFMRANTPTSVAQLGDGTFAVATLQGGIAVVDHSGRLLRVFDQQSGLSSNQVYSLFADRDGALWAMGPSHILRLALDSGVAVYGERNGYPPGGCESVAEFEGRTYAASHSDILRLSSDGSAAGTARFTPLGTTSSRFYGLLATPQGLLVAHYHGLGLWGRDGMRPVLTSDDVVFRISPSMGRPGSVLASLFDRVLSVDLQTGSERVVASALPDYGDTLADEPAGRTWIGTASLGLFVAGPGAVQSKPASPRFGPLPAAGPVLVSRAGPAIVAIATGAAFVLEPGSDRFRGIPGFPDGKPSAISNADPAGAVWAAVDPEVGAHSPRLGRIAPSGAGARWTALSIEGLSGIGSLLGLHVVHSADGDSLWIAGSEGLLCAGPVALAGNVPPRRPFIRAWVTTGRGLEVALPQTVPYSSRAIHIEFGSLDYGMRPSERYQTMLGGVETEWSPPTDSADRDILGLREGEYDFRVRLRSDSGETGEAATIHFVVAPPWWRTPLAYAALGVACALATFVFFRLRLGALRRRAARLERMVRQRTQELEKANAAKTEFVASMSHEIRNPMGGIIGAALQLSDTPLGPEQKALVSTLQNCASFLASLVEDVLDFSEIEAGIYKVAREPYSPLQVLECIVTMLGPRAGAATLRSEVDPALPGWVLGDAARIQQVLVNFTTNSLKFGGRNIGLSARAQAGAIEFAVSDDGVGIPAWEQESLFVRFSRSKSVRNSSIPGSGLGLAVSRMLAERMGGSVRVESVLRQGSTFFLRLPMQEAVAKTILPAFNAGGARALVVEDIEYNARALGVMLGKFGFSVEFASDGAEAMARLASRSYRTVFLDCDLPGLSGVEIARSFRATQTPDRQTFIVATTALSTVSDREACLAAGMDAFITKPITPDKIAAVLSGSRGDDTAEAPEPSTAPGRVTVDLKLIRHLTDGSPEGLDRELARFTASFDEVMRGVTNALATGSTGALTSTVHKVLSHARMVGATELAGTASDLQEFAAVYTAAELAGEIALLARRAAELRDALERARRLVPAGA